MNIFHLYDMLFDECLGCQAQKRSTPYYKHKLNIIFSLLDDLEHIHEETYQEWKTFYENDKVVKYESRMFRIIKLTSGWYWSNRLYFQGYHGPFQELDTVTNICLRKARQLYCLELQGKPLWSNVKS